MFETLESRQFMSVTALATEAEPATTPAPEITVTGETQDAVSGGAAISAALNAMMKALKSAKVIR